MLKLLDIFFVWEMKRRGKKIIDDMERSCIEPNKENANSLMKIIGKNANTVLGKKYNFGNIHSVSEYQKNVPISDYSDYGEMVKRTVNGEKNLMFKGLPAGYFETSGSIGHSKIIPCSKSYAASIFDTGTPSVGYYLYGLEHKINPKHAKILAVGAVTDIKPTNSGPVICDLVALYAMQSKFILPFVMTTPLDSMFCEDSHNRTYVHLLFALLHREELFVFVAMYLVEIADLIRCLNANQDTIIHDLEMGSISESIHIPSDLRKKLNRKLKSSPEIAKCVRDILKEGNSDGIFNKLFPNLKVLYAIAGGGDLEQQTKLAQKYAGKNIRILSYCHGASEALMGKPLHFDENIYVPLVDETFMEFIDMEDEGIENPPIYTLEQLQIGHEYEIILTTKSGLYRYRIYDVIRVVGKKHKMPLYEFAYRKGMILNIAGEKTMMWHVSYAIKECERQLGLEIVDYAVCSEILHNSNHYKFFLELSKESSVSAKEIAEFLYKELQLANPDLAYQISIDGIDMTVVSLVQPETFHHYRQKRKMSTAGGGNLMKITKLIRNQDMRDFLESHTLHCH